LWRVDLREVGVPLFWGFIGGAGGAGGGFRQEEEEEEQTRDEGGITRLVNWYSCAPEPLVCILLENADRRTCRSNTLWHTTNYAQ